jgi:hypothetical protein
MICIYQLQNFKQHTKEYCFTDKGEPVYDYTYSFSDTNPMFTRIGLVHYRKTKTNEEVRETTEVLKKVIDFNKLPEEIQGLFVLYRHDISAIRNAMTKKQWKNILNKYSK